MNQIPIHLNEYNLSNRIETVNDEASKQTPIEIKILTQLLLFFLVFGMSASIEITELRKQLKSKLTFIVGLAMQFIVMPFLGFVSVFTLRNHGLETPMGLTLLMVTASPGGSYSNLLCSSFNASIELSIAITSISTILSIIMLPANLILYSHLAFLGGEGGGEGNNNDGSDLNGKNILSAIDFPALLTSIGVTIAAILLGISSSIYMNSDYFRKRSNIFGTACGVALIVISILFSTNNNETKPWEQSWSFYVGVAMPCVVGLIITNMIAMALGLEKPQVVTLSVECSYQNIAIATSAVVAMFNAKDQSQALAVPLFYGMVETLFVGMYCFIAWKLGWTYAPKNDPICKVLCQRYDPLSDAEELQESECMDEIIQELRQASFSARGIPKRQRSAPRMRGSRVSVSEQQYLDVERGITSTHESQFYQRSRSAPTRAFLSSRADY